MQFVVVYAQFAYLMYIYVERNLLIGKPWDFLLKKPPKNRTSEQYLYLRKKRQ